VTADFLTRGGDRDIVPDDESRRFVRPVLSAFCVRASTIFGLCLLLTLQGFSEAQEPAGAVALKLVNIGPTGIALKRPVFGGACKACPWGVLALITQAAMKPYGYDVKNCYVCWSEYGPREIADRLKPIFPVIEPDDQVRSYIENPPDAVPDFSATSEPNLIAAWNGTGPYAKDHMQRHNLRVIAVVYQPNFLMMAANAKSGITDLAQLKDRTQPTWIAFTPRDQAMQSILDYYGITEAGLKAHGGGFLTSGARLRRATADVFIGGTILADTPEQRMWYEVSQLDDLVFFDMPEPLRETIAQQGSYQLGTAPIALIRSAERPIPTVVRSANVIYTRDDAPDQFTYDVAKALDEHQDLFRMYGDPWYYDARSVASSSVIPMAPGAMKYYRERGYAR
jgi:TRAP transporter TAXI family solute receptor